MSRMGGQAVVYAAVAAGGALGSVARYLCSVGALALRLADTLVGYLERPRRL